MLRRGVDPIAQWRGYSTDAEAAALVRAQGSMVRLAGLAMRRTGFRLTRDPRPGDVAVVAPMSGTHQTCAIRTERGWVMRLDDGIAMIPAGQMRVLAAWRV
ncbi:MAG TPA: hypothetical protein VEW06_06440 [Xanthobacteraceae bacterium]|nr:hypothetical protein [Xanthobacteraceae bacterium]